MHPKMSPIPAALGIALLGGLLMAADYESGVVTYYDGQQLAVAVTELDPRSAQEIMARKPAVYRLYDCDHCEPDGQVYVSVIDAITEEGDNTLWRGIQIEFNPGYPCRQFTSDEQIAEAVAAGQISLSATRQVYRCEVLGADN